MEQLQLLLRDKKREVSVDIIIACKNFLEAVKLSKSISGYEDKQVAGTLGIDAGQWSRILSGDANFPLNKLIDFMELCENKIPLIWLALQCGYTLSPLKTELEIELERERQEKDEYRKKYEYAIEALKAVRA